jgi:hypothetical protein
VTVATIDRAKDQLGDDAGLRNRGRVRCVHLDGVGVLPRGQEALGRWGNRIVPIGDQVPAGYCLSGREAGGLA